MRQNDGSRNTRKGKSSYDYTEVNGVLLPNLVSTETQYEIGQWGLRHLDYIKKYRMVLYTTLKTSCSLNTHLHEVDIRAEKMYDRLVKQLAEIQGVTEQTKAEDPLAWTQVMNNIANQAREIVNQEVIYNA